MRLTAAAQTQVIPAAGTIIATPNGGFSWLQQTLGSFTYSCPSTETNSGVYSNGIAAIAVSAGGVLTTPPVAAGSPNPNWCYSSLATTPAAYSPVASMSANNIPYIAGVAFTQQSGVYKGWAVGNRGTVYTTTFTPSTVTPFITATSWVFYNGPAAFSNAVQQASGWVNLWGIVWDNSNVGYVYGVNCILSTHDGGMNWRSETPNSMIVGGAANIWGVATVPTTY